MADTITIDPLSVQSRYLELRALGSVIGKATGFLLRTGGGTFLVSNWHVLSGRDVRTGQPLHGSGAVPDSVAISFRKVEPGGWQWEDRSFPLVQEDGKPMWIQHPLGQAVDIAALRIEVPSGFETDILDWYNLTEDMELAAGIPVFIVGYPFAIQAGGRFPIWKRGSIASDPDIPIDDLPKFFIDSATRSGMSGSPVVARESVSYRATDGTIKMKTMPPTMFVGIYSGRLGSEDDLQAQLGYVWKRELIFETIGGGQPGSFNLIS